MIAACKIDEVQRLLTEGRFSQRQIAKRTGVSRATIATIAAGERPDYEAQRQLRQLQRAEEESLGPVQRCAGCGGLAHMPCRLCRVRKLQTQRRAAARHEREQIRQRELRRLLWRQRAIALGEHPTMHRGAA